MSASDYNKQMREEYERGWKEFSRRDARKSKRFRFIKEIGLDDVVFIVIVGLIAWSVYLWVRSCQIADEVSDQRRIDHNIAVHFGGRI